MHTSKLAYRLMLTVTLGFVLYTLYYNFIHDPQATAFLSNKTNLAQAFSTVVWLKVMYVHVMFACIAMLTGAVNFSGRVLRQYPKFHRINGYLYLAAVLIIDLTSGYMAPYATGGKASSIAFNFMNILWFFLTVVALVKIKKKQIHSHRKWMVRSYAFCFTNMLIHLLNFVLQKSFGLTYATSYTISIYSTIVLLLLAAEFVIRTVYKKPVRQ
ncbi:DUF2306 domain-containing protein [Paenibacillus sp. GCM10012307]|uniref:DUF2306 domain-containing protein n=1 Tax=Paenibacillus roseus TaxID=2798579 RepID=A0A934MUU4_9BACL|nr:DUF2306 domain-containing protein [Paenibacillus roseus]MBJ6361437.1 DUF2306 domain-containing protein [Paenibacillus roseus]